ncbi:MAG: dipicolinate synthase subunit B [Ruminococcaceae bacterium]|nr:dipicolinate synthase subunit B [Oscillospiraceae bacterium]
MIGYAFCGSFCTLSKSFSVFQKMISDGKTLLPIVSENVYKTDTRFGRADEFCASLENASGNEVIHTFFEAEPLGPKIVLDALVICPCTGNTLAKIANGITDTAVTMAAKAHLRSDRPLVIALASNDALSANLKNIATLLERKNVYFVPMKQDDPVNKPHSLVADFSRLEETLENAMNGKQIQKIFE